ncbi:MAG: CbiM family transporter [Halochromatium sp.]
MAHIPDGVLSAPVLISGALVSTGLLGVALHRLREAELPQAAVLAATFFVSSLISVPLGPSSVHLLLNGLMGLLLGWAAVPAIFVALLLQAIFFGFGGLLVLGVNTMNLALPALLVARLLRPRLQRLANLAPDSAPDLAAAHGPDSVPDSVPASEPASAPARAPERTASGAVPGAVPGAAPGAAPGAVPGAAPGVDVPATRAGDGASSQVSSTQRRQALMIGSAAGVLAVLLTGLMLSASLVLSGEAFWPAARVIALSFVPLALIEGVLTSIVVAFLLRVEPALLRLEEA